MWSPLCPGLRVHAIPLGTLHRLAVVFAWVVCAVLAVILIQTRVRHQESSMPSEASVSSPEPSGVSVDGSGSSGGSTLI